MPFDTNTAMLQIAKQEIYKQTNATTQHNIHHVTERTHVPRRPCLNYITQGKAPEERCIECPTKTFFFNKKNQPIL